LVANEAERNVAACRAMDPARQGGAPMTVIERKKDESIVIDVITLTIIEIRGDEVRLAIESPKDVTVHRQEVYEAFQAQARTGSETEARG
jgi:carbon storage regulator